MKRTICLMTAIVLLLSLPLSANARAYILNAEDVQGAAFTDLPALATALEEVFAGDVALFADEKMEQKLSLPLGTSMSTFDWYYVPNGNSFTLGKQCFIYANAVYRKLFGESVGRGTSLQYSEVLLSGAENMNFESLTAASVPCGAYVRTTEKQDGSYDGYSGHSLIILYYDAESITYLEGNADNKGLIRITIDSWQEFEERQLGGKGRYLCHIVAPEKERVQQLYGVPDLLCPSGHIVERRWNTAVVPTVGMAGEQQMLCGECGAVVDSRVLLALTDTSAVFEDVEKKDWFYKNDAVNFVYSNGIFKGMSDTVFAPAASMTRGMLVTVLGRLRGIDANAKENGFTDVNPRQYYAPYVSWAANQGIVDGFGDGSFRPDDNVTREQMSKIMAIFCALDTSAATERFADHTTIAKWARPYVYACKNAGLLEGRATEAGALFDPKAGTTRAEVATILYRIELK